MDDIITINGTGIKDKTWKMRGGKIQKSDKEIRFIRVRKNKKGNKNGR